jgi:hypothetical protein
MVGNKFIREFTSVVHPITTISRGSKMTLFDHLVGATGHMRRDGDAERFGGLEIDDQLHFCCTLNRQIGRFFAIENSAGIVGLAKGPHAIQRDRPVADRRLWRKTDPNSFRLRQNASKN